jgi:hypothetical protein
LWPPVRYAREARWWPFDFGGLCYDKIDRRPVALLETFAFDRTTSSGRAVGSDYRQARPTMVAEIADETAGFVRGPGGPRNHVFAGGTQGLDSRDRR